jgi:hypothetical protein
MEQRHTKGPLRSNSSAKQDLLWARVHSAVEYLPSNEALPGKAGLQLLDWTCNARLIAGRTAGPCSTNSTHGTFCHVEGKFQAS